MALTNSTPNQGIAFREQRARRLLEPAGALVCLYPFFVCNQLGVRAVFPVFADEQKTLVRNQSVAAVAAGLAKLTAEIDAILPQPVRSATDTSD